VPYSPPLFPTFCWITRAMTEKVSINMQSRVPDFGVDRARVLVPVGNSPAGSHRPASYSDGRGPHIRGGRCSISSAARRRLCIEIQCVQGGPERTSSRPEPLVINWHSETTVPRSSDKGTVWPVVVVI
jgi:hypothetical protein